MRLHKYLKLVLSLKKKKKKGGTNDMIASASKPVQSKNNGRGKVSRGLSSLQFLNWQQLHYPIRLRLKFIQLLALSQLLIEDG